MSDTLRTRIAALAVAHEWSPDGTGEGQCECDARWFKTKEMWADHLADAVIRELGPIPDRCHVDDQGRVWEWCGGQPGTWAWRITRLDNR